MLIVTQTELEQALPQYQVYFLLFGSPGSEADSFIVDLKKITKQLKGVGYGLVNLFNPSELKDYFNIQYIYFPTLIVFRHGKEIERYEGRLDKVQLKQFIAPVVPPNQIFKMQTGVRM